MWQNIWHDGTPSLLQRGKHQEKGIAHHALKSLWSGDNVMGLCQPRRELEAA
jgi:hypothetical protein